MKCALGNTLGLKSVKSLISRLQSGIIGFKSERKLYYNLYYFFIRRLIIRDFGNVNKFCLASGLSKTMVYSVKSKKYAYVTEDNLRKIAKGLGFLDLNQFLSDYSFSVKTGILPPKRKHGVFVRAYKRIFG
jgi:hypothetical protein